MYYVHITGWDPGLLSPTALEKNQEVKGSKLEIFVTDPHSPEHCPNSIASPEHSVYSTLNFGLRTSGNTTRNTPKSSYKVKFAKKERFLDMSALNLKAMWNDVSQMREFLAWDLFAKASVPAPLQTYAKLCINNRYFGLYSLIEEVDPSFLETRFGANSKGNLYKAYWMPDDIGPATLAHRQTASGDDSGRAYFHNPDPQKRTYELKTNKDKDDPAEYQTYDDLARFIKTLHSFEPASNEFRVALEKILDVRSFLRWAAVNMLIGAWDNYWATPANYHLYNAGPKGQPKGFMANPYFHWIPWDYDNSFGISFFPTRDWQYADILDWSTSTRTYNREKGTSDIPLITRTLANPEFRAYYLGAIEALLDSYFNTRVIDAQVERIFEHIKTAVFLESDSPQGRPHTGRQWTNDQVYWNGRLHYELQTGPQMTWGIHHYVKMRYESARQQLSKYK